MRSQGIKNDTKETLNSNEGTVSCSVGLTSFSKLWKLNTLSLQAIWYLVCYPEQTFMYTSCPCMALLTEWRPLCSFCYEGQKAKSAVQMCRTIKYIPQAMRLIEVCDMCGETVSLHIKSTAILTIILCFCLLIQFTASIKKCQSLLIRSYLSLSPPALLRLILAQYNV